MFPETKFQKENTVRLSNNKKIPPLTWPSYLGLYHSLNLKPLKNYHRKPHDIGEIHGQRRG